MRPNKLHEQWMLRRDKFDRGFSQRVVRESQRRVQERHEIRVCHRAKRVLRKLLNVFEKPAKLLLGDRSRYLGNDGRRVLPLGGESRIVVALDLVKQSLTASVDNEFRHIRLHKKPE